MYFIKIIAISLFILTLPHAPAASARVIEVLDFEEVEGSDDDCQFYRLTTKSGHSTSTAMEELCLKNVPVQSGHYLFMVNEYGAVRSIKVERYFGDEFEGDVLFLSTREYAFRPEEYIELRIGEAVDEGGKPLCVISAVGVVDVKTFKLEFPRRSPQPTYLDMFYELEAHIKARQPWCMKKDKRGR